MAQLFAPVVVMAITMPLAYSIATGIELGFISYTAIKILAGRVSEVGIPVIILSTAFIINFAVS
jgi:adenine/guanine/hypoxanthine permease